MIIQVTATMFFDQEDEARDFFHDCLTALPKATVINPGQPDQQCSYADFIGCRHDEHPHEPCTLATHVDNCPPENP